MNGKRPQGKVSEGKVSRVAEVLAKGKQLNSDSRKAGVTNHQVTSEHAAIAKRAVRVGAAISRSANLGKQPDQGSGTKGTPRVSDQLAGHGARHLGGLGTPLNGGAHVPNLKPKVSAPEVTLRNASGKVVDRIPRVISKEGRPSLSKGIASPYQYKGSRQKETEFHQNGQRHVLAEGHQLLGSIDVPSVEVGPGVRLPGGLWLMHPDALGGRLNLLAQQFEEHKINRLRVHYVPSVPTTTVGSIAMYYRNDVATPVTDVGLDELKHAATHPSFIQTQIWESCSMDIKPDDANVRYFDEERGDFRTMVQGLVQVLSASSLTNDSGAFYSYGNLYLEYAIEFYGEELDYEVQDMDDVEIELAAINYAYAVPGNLVSATLTPTYAGAAVLLAIPQVGATFDNPDILFYGTVMDSTSPPFMVHTDATNVPYALAPGMGVYARVVGSEVGDAWTSESWRMIFFEDLSSASGVLNSDVGNIVGTEGQLRWAEDNGVPSDFTGSVNIRFHQMGLSNS